MEGKIFFVAGIDTNVGKTVATGLLARALAEVAGRKVITQKMIQTGCPGVSEDIEAHRRLQGIPFQEEDLSGLTCPYVFTYPCSPHMAAERDGRKVDLRIITEATERLRKRYEYVLLEGVGGLMVPIEETSLVIDYVRERGYPLLLVTSAKLGSLNHTLLSLYACERYGIPVRALIYNRYPIEDEAIEANSLAYLRARYPSIPIIVLPHSEEGRLSLEDIAPLL